MRVLQLSMLEQPSQRAKLRLLRDCEDVAPEVVLLALADMMATSSDPAYLLGFETARALAAELFENTLAPPCELENYQLLTGKDIMDVLGIDAGPQVGRILQELHRAEWQGLIHSREEALSWLKAWKD